MMRAERRLYRRRLNCPSDSPLGAAFILYSSSAAAKAVTGHPTNGWLFWRPPEDSEG
jgi:hypothetical protein